jgi:hypothetical protein
MKESEPSSSAPYKEFSPVIISAVATVGIGLLHTRVSLKSEFRSSKLDNVLLVQWGIESYLYRTCSKSYIRVFLSIFVSPPACISESLANF